MYLLGPNESLSLGRHSGFVRRVIGNMVVEK